tara:strand:+ start:5680 stop:7365 length:1686 start_codon:yes stop_codon:yes gene_type:complete
MGNYTGPSPARSFAPVATKDRFSGDGSSVNFDLSFDIPSGGFNSLNVYVEDVWQEPTVAYTVGNDGSGNPRRVTFTTAPPSGTNNIVIINRDRETARVIPDANSITATQLNSEMITGLTEVTAVGADHVLIYDANQTALKKALVSTLGNTVSNSANNRILTDTGTTGSINAESNLTFDGSTVALTGSQTVSGTVTAAGFTIGSAAINEAELEILDGATISTNELNSLASIGSDTVATQLATKAPLASPALTGTATGVNLTLSGNLTVNGTTTTLATTNSVISDNMIELNTGSSSNANDCGIVIERGSTGDNAIFAWDESVDRFILGTTTATGASTGDLTIAAAPLEVSGLIIGSADINETELEILDGATLSTTELNYVDGVTSPIQTQLNARLPLAGGTMTGDLILGDNVKIEVGDATGGDLQIYHDGSDSYIADASTGSLKLLTDTFRVQNPAGTENMIVATENSGVSLHFDNDAKLTTVTGGVNITGTATATTFSGSGASLTSLPAANISGQLPTGSTVTLDYDSIPLTDPGVKGRLYINTTGGSGGNPIHRNLAVSDG